MIDNRVITLAKIQASLFEYSCKNKDCSSAHFIKQFLFSSVALRLSDVSFVYSNIDVPYLYNELANEKKLNFGKNIYPEAVMHWIGYLLAIIVIEKNLSPKQVYRIITPNELYVSYEAYHSLDIEDAANRIIESKYDIDKNNIEVFKSTR